VPARKLNPADERCGPHRIVATRRSRVPNGGTPYSHYDDYVVRQRKSIADNEPQNWAVCRHEMKEEHASSNLDGYPTTDGPTLEGIFERQFTMPEAANLFQIV